jgi:hypothetical protein
MLKRYLAICLVLWSLAACAQTSNIAKSNVQATVTTAPATVEVVVDCADVMGPRSHPENYLNTSILHAPPIALADRVVKEYGRPKIMRCWLTLRHMWDRKTDAYNYNFKIPRRAYEDEHQKDKSDGTSFTNVITRTENFEEYLDAFSLISDEVILNIRNYEREVIEGDMTMDKWKEVFGKALQHYKKRCPNLKYIEVLNEYDITAAMDGLHMDTDQYYQFYRAAYEVINQFNHDYKPAIPLLVGGPCTYSYLNAKPHLRRFLECYAQDTNALKRIDFFSFHDYECGRTPSLYGKFESIYQEEFPKYGIPTNLPLFLTEIGFGGEVKVPGHDPERSRAQAAAVTTFEYYARHSANVRIFPWVLFHCRNQICYAQFTQDLAMTPFGAAVKAWSLQKSNEIGAVVDRKKSEYGVYALASLDETGAAIQVWNYQVPADNTKVNVGPDAVTRVAVRNLPAKWKGMKLKVRQFMIDSTHSNCFVEGAEKGGRLELIKTMEVKGKDLDQLTVHLEPNAICLWVIEMP